MLKRKPFSLHRYKGMFYLLQRRLGAAHAAKSELEEGNGLVAGIEEGGEDAETNRVDRVKLR